MSGGPATLSSQVLLLCVCLMLIMAQIYGDDDFFCLKGNKNPSMFSRCVKTKTTHSVRVQILDQSFFIHQTYSFWF